MMWWWPVLSACTPVEHCDGVDEDGDGVVDEGAVDEVVFYVDGYGGAVSELGCEVPVGQSVGGDCDDADPGISPGIEEACTSYGWSGDETQRARIYFPTIRDGVWPIEDLGPLIVADEPDTEYRSLQFTDLDLDGHADLLAMP